jgi:hypothetical protein
MKRTKNAERKSEANEERLAKTWKALIQQYRAKSYGLSGDELEFLDLIERRISRPDPKSAFSHPLHVLAHCVSIGLYPPPETLVSIATAFNRYLKGTDEISLEEAFFGPAKRRVGNHSARQRRQLSDMSWQIPMMWLVDNVGLSQTMAAEIIAESRDVDPQSLARQYRTFKREVELERRHRGLVSISIDASDIWDKMRGSLRTKSMLNSPRKSRK